MQNFISRSLDELVEFQRKNKQTNETKFKGGNFKNTQNFKKNFRNKITQLKKPRSPNNLPTHPAPKINTSETSYNLSSFMDVPLDEASKFVRKQLQSQGKKDFSKQLVPQLRSNLGQSQKLQSENTKYQKNNLKSTSSNFQMGSKENKNASNGQPNNRFRIKQRASAQIASKNQSNNPQNRRSFNANDENLKQVRLNTMQVTNNLRRSMNPINKNNKPTFKSGNILLKRKFRKQSRESKFVENINSLKANTTISGMRLASKGKRNMTSTNRFTKSFLGTANKARKLRQLENGLNTSLNRSKNRTSTPFKKFKKPYIKNNHNSTIHITPSEFSQDNLFATPNTNPDTKNYNHLLFKPQMKAPFNLKSSQKYTSHPQLTSNKFNSKAITHLALNEYQNDSSQHLDLQMVSKIRIMASLDNTPDPLPAQKLMNTPHI